MAEIMIDYRDVWQDAVDSADCEKLYEIVKDLDRNEFSRLFNHTFDQQYNLDGVTLKYNSAVIILVLNDALKPEGAFSILPKAEYNGLQYTLQLYTNETTDNEAETNETRKWMIKNKPQYNQISAVIIDSMADTLKLAHDAELTQNQHMDLSL